MKHRLFLLLLLGSPLTAWGLAERISAGDLTLRLVSAKGVQSHTLVRSTTGTVLAKGGPLFEVKLIRKGKSLLVDSRKGWGKFSLLRPSPSGGLTLRWEEPRDPTLAGFWVEAQVSGDSQASSLSWTLRARAPAGWTVESVAMPQLRIPASAKLDSVFYPHGSGVLRPVNKQVRYRRLYPSAEAGMQFLAAYSDDKREGLYAGFHDPLGSAKEIYSEVDPSRALQMGFRVLAQNAGTQGGSFEHSGCVVWQLLAGDWFDAASLYKRWVRAEARWYTRRVAARNRAPWMAQNALWATSADSPEKITDSVSQLGKQLGVPIAFHWYSWHLNPFDNDYPHFFPAKPEFGQVVRKLQSQQIPVVPYLNARLWDTRDRGLADFEFSQVAKAAAAKLPSQEVLVESYESKEGDGSKVKMAVMCPATAVWQNKVRELTLRLWQEYQVQGVYLDQVAASAPALCMDPSHGHPLGGGHWWVDSYEQMIESIRRQAPVGRALLSESNAEPYLHLFDGLLMWHWQEQGQVPAFSAVYGGGVPAFGRFFGNGSTRDLAFRMRLGQQLVFGEQLGWFNPALLSTVENQDFAKQLAQLRHQYREFFVDGEMARPPQFRTPIPKVRADWQWLKEHWVETDAVLTGAWIHSSQSRKLLLFVNVSDRALKAELQSPLKRILDLPPRAAQALEIDETAKR